MAITCGMLGGGLLRALAANRIEAATPLHANVRSAGFLTEVGQCVRIRRGRGRIVLFSGATNCTGSCRSRQAITGARQSAVCRASSRRCRPRRFGRRSWRRLRPHRGASNLGRGVPPISAIPESVTTSADASTIWITGSNLENASAIAVMSSCKFGGCSFASGSSS